MRHGLKMLWVDTPSVEALRLALALTSRSCLVVAYVVDYVAIWDWPLCCDVRFAVSRFPRVRATASPVSVAVDSPRPGNALTHCTPPKGQPVAYAPCVERMTSNEFRAVHTRQAALPIRVRVPRRAPG